MRNSLKKNLGFFIVIIALFLSAETSLAKTKVKNKKPAPQSEIIVSDPKTLDGPGAIRGGQSEQYMSLLDIRRSAEPKLNTERLVIDWGDRYFERTDKGGYYQVEYREKPLQLILSFSLTLNTKFENDSFSKKIVDGLYIKDAHLEFDSVSQAVVMTIDLRQKVKIKIIDYSGSASKKATAKLALDLVGAK